MGRGTARASASCSETKADKRQMRAMRCLGIVARMSIIAASAARAAAPTDGAAAADNDSERRGAVTELERGASVVDGVTRFAPEEEAVKVKDD